MLYKGELDVLCIRLHELCKVVHRFTLVESDTTFSGIPKRVSYEPLEPRIASFAEKIRHVVVADMPKTENPWDREAWQRNAIMRGVPDADPNDLIVISDLDEIPRASTILEMSQEEQNCIFGLRLAFLILLCQLSEH
jgi:Glycosyltransferase family 17